MKNTIEVINALWNCLLNNGYLLVRISLVPYKYTTIFMHIAYGYVLATYRIYSQNLIKVLECRVKSLIDSVGVWVFAEQ